MTKAKSTGTSTKKIVIMVLLVLLMLVVLFALGIGGMFGIGSIATNSMDTAMNTCKVKYATDIEKAVDNYYSTNKSYPTTLTNFTSPLLNQSTYTDCASGVTYASDGKTYSINANLKNYKDSNSNVVNGVYSVSK